MLLYGYGWRYVGLKLSHLISQMDDFDQLKQKGYPFHVDHLVNNTIHVNPEGLRLINFKRDKKYIIWSGGSNMFGEKISEEQTILNQSLVRYPESKFSYIGYSYPGWGPNNILARFDYLKNLKINKSSKGFFVYLLMDIHIERVCGSNSYYLWSSGLGPQYKLVDEKLVNTGVSFFTFYFHWLIIKNGVKKILTQLGLSSFKLNANNPLIESDKCLNLFVKVLKSLEQEFKASFPNGRMLIPYYNFHKLEEERYLGKLKAELDADFIAIDEHLLDIRNNPKKYFLPDGHFNSYSLSQIAKIMNEYIYYR